MPNVRITELTELAPGGIAPDDVLEIVDVSAGSNSKIRASSFASITTAEMPFTPPTISTFSLQRQGSTGSITNLSSGRGVRITAKGTSTNLNELSYAMVPITSGSNGWQAVARLRRHSPIVNWCMTGMLVRNSTSGKSDLLSVGSDAAQGLNFNSFSSDTAWAGVAGLLVWSDLDFWLKVSEISGTRKWFVSKDGEFWVQVQSQQMTAAYVTSATHVGFHLNPNFGNVASMQNIDHAFDCLSWSQTAL